jgi:hypothetical protein
MKRRNEISIGGNRTDHEARGLIETKVERPSVEGKSRVIRLVANALSLKSATDGFGGSGRSYTSK